jgi:2-C-methyl-D-erythritol 4-phosphate cytidylyltransferase
MSTNWCGPLPRDAGAVVVAAGQGTRYGGARAKQYEMLNGIPLLLRAVRPFAAHPDIACTVVVLPPQDVGAPPEWLGSLAGEALRFVAGGATRRESVARGLAALPAECTVVLVHDGARPFPPRAAIDAGIVAARAGHGAVPALPVADTIKRADDFGTVLCTVARQGLWRAQTPQAFPRALLERAHATDAGLGEATDDAMLVELAGGRVDLIPGDPRNLKITTRTDLELAEWWMGRGS